MAEASKTAPKKIVDVASPEQRTPSASSRPIILTNRPVMANDPMMVASEDTTKQTAPTTSPEVPTPGHQEKIIAPLHTEASEPDETVTEEPKAAAVEPSMDDKTAEEDAEPSEDVQQKSEISIAAKAEAEQEAAEKRQAELEALIEKGTYAVPINAVKRKRSRQVTAALIVVCLLLVVVAADVALDSGLIKVSGVPHTHYFTK